MKLSFNILNIQQNMVTIWYKVFNLCQNSFVDKFSNSIMLLSLFKNFVSALFEAFAQVFNQPGYKDKSEECSKIWHLKQIYNYHPREVFLWVWSPLKWHCDCLNEQKIKDWSCIPKNYLIITAKNWGALQSCWFQGEGRPSERPSRKTMLLDTIMS